VEGRITEEFWRRKEQAWEAEMRVIDDERARVEVVRPGSVLTAAKTLGLAKQAENLYKSQNPNEQ
jgi:NAD dependent epimerase/dehydratase family enzyme